MNKLIAAAGAACLIFATAASGPSARAVETRSVIVEHADLDLSNEADVRTMLRRIRAAAERVCRRASDYRDLLGRREYFECVRAAADGAVAALGAPLVTALHEGGKSDQRRFARASD
ncbi:MAG: UrcA family protein [Maricaulaceae bacterium]